METQENCARPIINRILSQLKCNIYPVGTYLFRPGDEMTSLYFFYKGIATMTTNFNSKVYEQNEIEVVKLPEGSFFGELSILLNIGVFFGLRVDGRDPKVQGERIIRDRYE